MTERENHEDEAEPKPEDSTSPDIASESAWAEEARAVAAGGTGAEVGDQELEQQAFSAKGDLDDDGDIDADDRVLATTRGRHTAEDAKGKGGPRVFQFLKASWSELRRVQWPDRRQVSQATGVVLGFVVITGAFLGFADWAAQQFVNFIL